MKKIFVLYTGGTIGMSQSEQGLRPDTAIINTALTPYHQMQFEWHICQPLIDSSAVQPQDWANWLAIVQKKLPEFDGILILHGTDTLAYTANFLALTLNTHNKPIILTGSQKPFNAHNSDAPHNLHTAINALLSNNIYEVLIAFNGKLFPAIGSSKISTESNDGFANFHFGQWQPKQHSTKFIVSNLNWQQLAINKQSAIYYLTPTQDLTEIANNIRHLATNNTIHSIILMTYGHGNAPANIKLAQAIQTFCSKGGLVLNISQVPYGNSASVYAQGDMLRNSGAINGGKCTIETATALLLLANNQKWQTSDLKHALKQLNLI